MAKFLGAIMAIAGFLFIIYCSYWIAKTVSYKLFYEDMVRAEITEMVCEDSLIRETE
jgi:hypothetical protein